jgi:hypothetical protein
MEELDIILGQQRTQLSEGDQIIQDNHTLLNLTDLVYPNLLEDPLDLRHQL